MERLINSENIYMQIQNLLEKEEDAKSIESKLMIYHFKLKSQDFRDNNFDEIKETINVYSKIAFYLLTRLTNFEFEGNVKIAGFNLAAFCFEILSKNGDLEFEDLEECKLLSAICYTLGNNPANSFVMADLIIVEDEYMNIYKLFMQRKLRKIQRLFFDESKSVQNAIKNISIAMIYKNSFEKELQNMKSVLNELKENDNNQVFYFRLIYFCAINMANNSIRQLVNYYPELKNYVDVLTKNGNVFELWESQRGLIESFEKMKDVSKITYVSMPTSAGKTLIAELILYSFVQRKDGVGIYVVPSLALENEIKKKFIYRFKKVGIIVSNGIEVSEEGEIICPQIIIATPEKVDLMLRNNIEFHQFIRCIIFDEFHKVSSGTRGWFEETLLIWVKGLQSKYNFKMVLISAIADDVQEKLNDDKIMFVEENWTPTRKLFCKFEMPPKAKIIYGAKSVKKREEISQEYDLVMKYPNEKELRIENVLSQKTYGKKNTDGKDEKRSDTKADICWKAVKVINERPLMIFFMSKKELKNFIIRSSTYLEVKEEILDLSDSVAKIIGEEHLLVKCLRYGVAFHDGDLPDDVRIVIEKAFKNKKIGILACTTSLADGVNLPAKALLMANIFTKNFDAGKQDFRCLDIGDYKNIVGRIGRALVDTEGSIYLLNYPELYKQKEIFDKYYNGVSVKSTLVSALDSVNIEKLETIEQSDFLELAKADKNVYKMLLQLQLLVFTLFVEFEDEEFDQFIKRFESYQVLVENNVKKKVFSKYAKKYHVLAKEINRQFLIQNTKTGVSYQTNIYLQEIANDLLDTDEWEFLITEDIYLKLLACTEFCPDNNEVDHYQVFKNWISGNSFETVVEMFSTEKKLEKYEEGTKYIKNVFQYIGPWMFSCLSHFLEEKKFAKRKVDDLKAQIRYGTQDEYVIRLCKKGIKSRDLAIAICEVYHEMGKGEDVIKWLLDVSDLVLYKKLVEKFDVTLLEQIGNLRMENRGKSSYFEKVNRIKCKLIKDRSAYEIDKKTKEIDMDKIYLKHIKGDPLNEFLIEVCTSNGQVIGYLPRSICEEISDIMDTGEKLECYFEEESEKSIWITLERNTIELI